MGLARFPLKGSFQGDIRRIRATLYAILGVCSAFGFPLKAPSMDPYLLQRAFNYVPPF